MRILGCGVLAFALTGCVYGDSRAISFANPEQGNAQRIFVWKSEYSAGMGGTDGMCAQGALTTKATSKDQGMSITDSMIPKAGDGADLIKLKNRVAQSVILTNVSNGQTAYANIALFYLCQISLNQKLKAAEITKMWKIANDTAIRVSANAAKYGTVASEDFELDEGDNFADAAGGNAAAGI